MVGQLVVERTRTMGGTQITQKGSLPRYVRQLLFDDLIGFERAAIDSKCHDGLDKKLALCDLLGFEKEASDTGYNIQKYFTPIGLFLAYKKVNTWDELFKREYNLDIPYAKRAKVFLPSLEKAKDLAEAIEFVASGYTDIELFRNASVEELTDTLSAPAKRGLFSLV